MLFRPRLLATLVAAVLLLAACGPSEPLNVVGIQTGKSLNSDHSVGTHAATFHTNDPMYVSVLNVGRGKGTIFLVDLKSRAVIWSAYQKSNSASPGTLDRTASRIVEQIKKAK